MSWNYRLIQHTRRSKRTGDHTWFAVHEVYYRDDGTIKAVSKEPSPIVGDTVTDANGTRVLMYGAFRQPPLEMAALERQWRAERRSTLHPSPEG